ncbi:MAG: TRAP transporter substrate-binding protein, partial [Gammaproteobacteria bacterium]|nr:TRAP transporter substrate-binding protein [Gammaproteobacteria bacterium]
MKRRDLVKLGAGSLLAGGMLAGCSKEQENSATVSKAAEETRKWKMVTTWPKDFPGLGTGANTLARVINEMSGGRLVVKVYGANELVPALEAFDTVANGTAEMGHAGAYYWKGKAKATQFFSAVPFGLTAQEMNGWLYYGGGMALWRELYEPFGLIPAAAGSTGVQMGGWFNKEINSIEDLKGLKMRIPGLGGEVLRRAGGTPVTLPGGEIFTSLQSGAIDATEWVGPYNDLAFGFYKAAKYYYYPGWHEPGTYLEYFFNKKAYDSLTTELKHIVDAACMETEHWVLAEFDANN